MERLVLKLHYKQYPLQDDIDSLEEDVMTPEERERQALAVEQEIEAFKEFCRLELEHINKLESWKFWK